MSEKKTGRAFKKKEKIELFECNFFNCELMFESQTTLRKHLLYHAGLNPFMCRVCGSSFKVEHNLTRHFMVQHDVQIEEKFKSTIKGYEICNVCLALIPNKELKAHIECHKMYFE